MRPTRARYLAAPLLLMLAGSSCIFGGHAGGDTRTLLVDEVIGKARVRANGIEHELEKGAHLAGGAVVRLFPAKDASIVLKRGTRSQVSLRPYDSIVAELTILSPGSLEVISGDVLITSDPAAPIEVSSQGVNARAGGTKQPAIFRVDRRLSMRVGVYSAKEGDVQLDSAIGSKPLPELREGVVAGRQLPREVTPLTVDSADPWDKMLLGDVIDLDRDLTAQSRGYEAAFGDRMKGWRDLAVIVPGRDLSFLDPYLEQTGSADVLIGTVFGLVLERHGHGHVTGVFKGLINLLDQGASWGLLAHQYLGPALETELKDAVVRAIGLKTGEVRGTVVPPPVQPTNGPPPSSPTPTTSVHPSPKPTRSPSPSPTPTGSTSPTPTPTCNPIDQVLGRCK